MRLVCPNCEAKYEVPEDAIPDTGRDVQCTNCGHSWFQMRGKSVVAPVVPEASAEAVTDAVTEAETAAMAAAAAEMPTEEVSPQAKDDTPVEAMETVPSDDPVAAETAAVADAVEAPASSDAGAKDVPSEEPQVVEPLLDAAGPDAVGANASATEANAAEASAVEASAAGASAAGAEASVTTQSGPEADNSPATEPEPVVEAVAEGAAEAAPVADAASEAEPVVDAAAEPVLDGPVADVSLDADREPAAEPATEPTAEAGSDTAPAEASTESAEETLAAPAAAVAAATYAVDDSVLAILREEAEREANARRAESLESQTDLGIDTAMPRKAAALAEAEAKPAARRDLLPDVEEINSTLRPSEVQADSDAPDFVAPPPQAPRGFRSGFLSLMTIAILAAALYLVAPRLADVIPALAGPLESYVSFIDSLRLGLDGVMRSATVAISDG